MTALEMPALIVDRSPGLMRGAFPFLQTLPGGRLITMTEEDVSSGVRGDPGDCPVAHMIMRVPGVLAVDLSGPQPTFRDKFGLEHNITLPPEIVDWIGRFDRGEPVGPLAIMFNEVE